MRFPRFLLAKILGQDHGGVQLPALHFFFGFILCGGLLVNFENFLALSLIDKLASKLATRLINQRNAEGDIVILPKDTTKDKQKDQWRQKDEENGCLITKGAPDGHLGKNFYGQQRPFDSL